jgi:hypothetical protein
MWGIFYGLQDMLQHGQMVFASINGLDTVSALPQVCEVCNHDPITVPILW